MLRLTSTQSSSVRAGLPVRLAVVLQAAVLAVLPAVVACPTPTDGGGGEGEGEGEGEGGEGEGENPGTGDCPIVPGGHSACDVQDPASPNHPGDGALVTLKGVVATTASFVLDKDDTGAPRLFGVFVADTPPAKRGGVLVEYPPTVAVPSFSIGDALTITGQAREVSIGAPNGETRVTAQTVVADGGNTPVAPLAVTASDLGEVDGEDYEGTLVTLSNVSVESIGDFGQFTLSGGVVVDDTLFRYTAIVGETLTSITGVVGYNIFSGGGFRLLPRSAADVVAGERPTNSVTDLNDGTIERCAFNNASACPAIVADAVVVSPVVFDRGSQSRFDRFLFWVADANNVDANGRLGPQSGVMVSVLKERLPTSASYTFAQDDNRDFLPGAAPAVGDVVTIVGHNTEDFGQGEFEANELQKVTTTVDSPDFAVLPALFGTGGRDPALLKGGRPAFDGGDFPGIEDVAASAEIAQWQGVLVELAGVQTTSACYAVPYSPSAGTPFARDFGYFLVTGDVEVGDLFRLEQSFGGFFLDNTANDIPDTAKTCDNVADKCEDSRVVGQTFTKLVGVVDFAYDVHRVNPRNADDIDVSTGFVAANTPAGNCPTQ
jgi:hypothetical protein